MDIHDFGGEISVADIAEAHRWDREVERQHQVCFRGCWVDQRSGRVFCLVEAPDAAAAAAVHRDSHGLVAHEVHEVHEVQGAAASRGEPRAHGSLDGSAGSASDVRR